ncbi:Uma2 family endonuclease [Streptomyces demainii]|uniref:Uma2 family endonuclease n=2 Tax=Streptomyces TaxID=1883 RepID=A0ABT9KPU2_9ACTN|nr:Uma2 family endonuclease [Streptomyces demainii]
MSAMAHEPLTRDHDDVLLEGFLALETPEGFRAELIEGEIVVTAPPDGYHENHINLIVKQVIRKSAAEMDFSGNRGLTLPRGGLCVRNHVIPDATFAPTGLQLFCSTESWMPCDGVAMVAEVTSTKPDRDRTAKRHCYARGGIPLYLLVDREKSDVTLFGDPEGADYRQHVTVPFGKQLDLPAPFSFALETTDFL